jgi:hypothetical protein
MVQDYDNKDILTKKVDKIAKKYLERSKVNKGSKTNPDKSQNRIVQLPFCRESERTIPNIIARSALFGVTRRGTRSYKEKELIASRDDIKIYYTGKTLDQADCTVWMQAVSMASTLGKDIPVNRSGFLKSLGKTTGKKDYLWLDASLHRLMTSVVSVYTGKYHLEFHLIDMWGKFRDGDNPVEYILNINPKVIKMWSNSGYTRVEWNKRLAIKHGSDLASWMQLYIRSNASNGKPHHISLHKLKIWCGRETSELRKFRNSMKRSLAELTRIGEIKDATIREDDMVKFSRISTSSIDQNLTLHHRDSLPDHRDSLPGDHRDSLPGDRDSLPVNRDSFPVNRDSFPPPLRNLLNIKKFFKVFFL